MRYGLQYPELNQEFQMPMSGHHRGIRFSNVVALPIECGVVMTAASLKQYERTVLQCCAIENIGVDIPFTRRAAQVENTTSRSEALAKEFQTLVDQWTEETFFLSSLGKQFTHPAYVRIMAMGREGLPLVLNQLQRSQDNWFYALKYMAGRDVAAGINDCEAAKAAWLAWGYENNYI